MKNLLFIIFTLSLSVASAQECPSQIDLLIVGDSQFGATWSRAYAGNFLQKCLKSDFALYARGGTILASWLKQGGMDHIETIQRDSQNEHLNIGSKEKVPACKKRLESMIDSHSPRRLLLEFGGNYNSQTDDFIRKDIMNLIQVIEAKKIAKENCYFLHQTYEMEVATKRNVPLKNLANMQRVGKVIRTAIENHCQFLDGFEIMKSSIYFDGKELLKRIPIEGRPGCMGPAANDNAHLCGEAAKDFANRVCDILN